MEEVEETPVGARREAADLDAPVMYALDRQGMSDSLQAGRAPVAHAYIEPASPYYKDIEASVVKYEYDPRKTAELIESLGYIRGPDGFYRDSAGQKLVVESRTNAGDDLKEKMVLVGADYWQRAGLGRPCGAGAGSPAGGWEVVITAKPNREDR